MAIGTQL